MDNLELYNRFRETPPEAKKEIKAGRIKGFTDINPLWRIQALTETFGPCGVGWKYTIDRKWLEPGANGETAGFVDISLYYKWDGEWSEAVPGTGGSSFIAKERNGLYTSDEVYKMALTDALSVACKALGIGADVYWSAGRTKYQERAERNEGQTEEPPIACTRCKRKIEGATNKKTGKYMTPKQIAAYSQQRFGQTLCTKCQNEEKQARDEEKAALAAEANGGPAA